jgi:two-component system, cell cycle sensor histidine kinase and response regulator CckA
MKSSRAKELPQYAVAKGGMDAHVRKIERREWWLWTSAILVTLLLTLGIVSFLVPILHPQEKATDPLPMNNAMRGLVGMVLLFDIYTVYQQLQIYRIRRQMAEREVLFRLITENAADMIAVVDSDGRRLYNSPSYQKILGYTPEELQNTSSLDQVHPDDRPQVQEAAKEALVFGVGHRIEYRMRHKDGSWHFLESSASTIRNAEGQTEKLVIVNRDITERRRLEEQFRQAQKMEAVGRLSGGIAHDFNNLLGVIIGYSEILQEKLQPTNPLRGSVDEILGAGRRAATLTRQLLAFSRQQVLEPKVLNLNAVLKDMGNMLPRMIGEDIELSMVLGTGLGRVKADQGQIEQIVMNLTVNSRDAMPDGGKLFIETTNAEIDLTFTKRYSYPVQQGSYVLLTVSDNGIGMDAATQAHIFEPFFTTKEKGKGTGLGLATAYGIVKQSGGYIDVYSELGKGTTFKIYLPRVHDALDSHKAPETDLLKSRGNETILLVEDEASLRTLTRNLLELSGYTVLEAKSGADAITISNQHDGLLPLLLTDVVMPGMSGRVLAAQLTQKRPMIKVLYMSGYTGQAVGSHGALEEGSFFLQKPFSRDGLVSKVRQALDSGLAKRPEEAPTVLHLNQKSGEPACKES